MSTPNPPVEEREPDGAPTESDGGATVGAYTWEDYKREFYYDEDGTPPTDGEVPGTTSPRPTGRRTHTSSSDRRG